MELVLYLLDLGLSYAWPFVVVWLMLGIVFRKLFEDFEDVADEMWDTKHSALQTAQSITQKEDLTAKCDQLQSMTKFWRTLKEWSFAIALPFPATIIYLFETFIF